MVADVNVRGAVHIAANRRTPLAAPAILAARRCAMIVGLVMVCRSQACVGSSPSLPARGRGNACFSCAVSPASSTGKLRGAEGGNLGSTGCRGVRSTGGSVRRAECEGGDVGMRSGTLRLRGGADAGGGNVAAPNGQVLPACERPSNRFSGLRCAPCTEPRAS